MSSNEVTSRGIVAEPLNEDNYVQWKSLIKPYLMAQDLWSTVKPPPDPKPEASAGDNGGAKSSAAKPEPNRSEELWKAWQKINARALHVIKISCGSEALSVIARIDHAGAAWNILKQKFKPQELRPLPNWTNDANEEIPPDYEDFYKMVASGDWARAKAFLDEHPAAVTARINVFGETALHIAIAYGHGHIVEELLKKLSDEELEIQQKTGYTALSLAAIIGSIPMARSLVERNPKLLRISAGSFGLPVLLAISSGQFEMARYLYPLTELEDLTGNYICLGGAPLLFLCILSKNFDIAMDLIKRCKKLTVATATNSKLTAPVILAMCSSAFPSGTSLVFWQRWIYKWFMRWIASYLSNFLGIKKVYKLKLVHLQSQALLQCTLENLRELRRERRDLVSAVSDQAMFKAVEEGNVEFVTEFLKVFPEMMRRSNPRGKTVFAYAVEQRQAEIFNLIHSLVIIKEGISVLSDDSGNNVLHMAGKLAPPSQLSHISGAALQMQRELQWFKEVERVMENKLIHKDFVKNSEIMTPREYFTENHKELAKEGEKWMKETATNCAFVSALIVTMMFAAAFIVPGGNEGDKTLAVISHKKWFLLYIISDAISLFSSTTSVLMFLGILTSRYYEEAFLKSLPTKLIIGLSTLFFSIATMMITFCSALYVMLQGQFTVFVPVVLLASVPVGIFMKLLFPLLVEIFVSTYGKGIFDRGNDNWMFQR